MTQVQAARSESPWVTAAMLTFSFVLVTFVFSLPLLVRSFLFQPFSIPAGSMIPTLLNGDNFFAAKYAYGYGRYTWPFWQPASGRIWGSDPARGDVVVFFSPKDNSTVYIKRVVGLPRDRVQMKQGLLYINGVPVVRERLADFIGQDPCGFGSPARTRRWRETLPNGVSHETLDCIDNGFYDNTSVYTVPSDHVFVLGDNRDNSTDSRVLNTMGYVPVQNIIGRAAMIYFSSGNDGPGTLPRPRTERIGLMVH